jgi:hypothetical protein
MYLTTITSGRAKVNLGGLDAGLEDNVLGDAKDEVMKNMASLCEEGGKCDDNDNVLKTFHPESCVPDIQLDTKVQAVLLGSNTTNPFDLACSSCGINFPTPGQLK